MTKLEWQDAPATTWWGHDMVVATVALGKDHSVDLYCARSKTAEAEALLKKPWVGLTDEEVLQIRENLQVVEGISLLENLTKAIGAALRSKNA